MIIYAVIPTGNRPEDYASVIEWCYNSGVTPVTIATSEEAQVYAEDVWIPDSTLNISRWWNKGINYALSQGDADAILILNDDVVLPDGWLYKIVRAILDGNTGASADRTDGYGMISGYAFGLNPKDNVLCDENLVWWYGDDDIQRQCEALNGFAIIESEPVENKYGDSSQSRMREQIQLDQTYYENKWGLKIWS